MLDSVADFGLGETHTGTDSDGNDINTSLDGRVYEFPVTEAVATAMNFPARLIGRRIKAMVARNKSSAAVLPGEVVSTTAANGVAGMAQIDAKSSAADRLCYIVDPSIPAAGCADNDLVHLIIGGPSKIKNAATPVSVTAGDLLTAGASGRLAAIGASTYDKVLCTALEDNNTANDLVDCVVHPHWV